MQLIIEDAIRQGIADGIQQSRRALSVASGFSLDPGLGQVAQLPGELPTFPEPYSPASSQRSQSSLSGEEGQREMELSEDEGLTPDQPVFTGLFHPALFRSLLFKARNSTRLGADHSAPDTAVGSADPTHPLDHGGGGYPLPKNVY